MIWKKYVKDFSRSNKGGLTLHLIEDSTGSTYAYGDNGRRHYRNRHVIRVDYMLQISADEEVGNHHGITDDDRRRNANVNDRDIRGGYYKNSGDNDNRYHRMTEEEEDES